MAATVFGYQALGDYGFVRGLRAGRSPRLATVERVAAWMDAYDAAHPNKRRAEWLRLRRAEEAGARKAVAAEKAKAKMRRDAAAAKRIAAAARREARAST